MAKKMISRLSVLAVLIVFLTARSGQTEYTNVISVDATAVASIDLKPLTNKAGMNDEENEATKQRLLETMKNGMSAATFQQLEKVINNPGASGLNPKAPVYILSSPQISSGAFAVKISNEDDLHTSSDVMAGEQVCQSVSEADRYNLIILNGNLLAFNETATITIFASRTSQTEAAKEAITKPMKQAADNSIAKSGTFQKIARQRSDINFFASMSTIPSIYRSQTNMRLPSEIRPEDITILGGLNFRKGKIALKTENYMENDAVKVLLKKQMESFGKTNGTFVRYFPTSTLMFINIDVKGDGLYNLLSENRKSRNTASITKADEVKELFNSLNGDISAGLINATMNSAPTFLAYTDVENGNAPGALYKNKQSLGMRKGENVMELSKDEYVYRTRGMNILLDIKDKQMYATNDELLYKSIGKTVDKSIRDAPYAADTKSKTVFVAINAEAILDLPVVEMLVGFRGKEFKTYPGLASKVSYSSVNPEGETSEIDFCPKNKNVDALKQIVDFAR